MVLPEVLLNLYQIGKHFFIPLQTVKLKIPSIYQDSDIPSLSIANGHIVTTLNLVRQRNPAVLPFILHIRACRLTFQPCVLPDHHTVYIRKHKGIGFIVKHCVGSAYLLSRCLCESPCYIILKFPPLAHCFIVDFFGFIRGLILIHLEGCAVGVEPAYRPCVRTSNPLFPVL